MKEELAVQRRYASYQNVIGGHSTQVEAHSWVGPAIAHQRPGSAHLYRRPELGRRTAMPRIDPADHRESHLDGIADQPAYGHGHRLRVPSTEQLAGARSETTWSPAETPVR